MKEHTGILAAGIILASLTLTPTTLTADVLVDSSIELETLQILPGVGTLQFLTPVTASAFAQVYDTMGGFGQDYQSVNGGNVSAHASTPFVTSTAAASAQFMTAKATTNINIPSSLNVFAGTVPGATYGQLDGSFEIVGATAPVSVKFDAKLIVSQILSTLGSSQGAASDVSLNMNVDGNQVLFFDKSYALGPNDPVSVSTAPDVSNSATFDPNTPLSFTVTLADETPHHEMPEPSLFVLVALGLFAIAVARGRWLNGCRRLLSKVAVLSVTGIVLLLLSQPAHAHGSGGVTPTTQCTDCPCNCTTAGNSAPGSDNAASGGVNSTTTNAILSFTEGNLIEPIAVSKTRSAYGPTINLSFVYNSYDADDSEDARDTVMGYGWTHSYNIFLFSQLGAMFRYDGNGAITRYAIAPGGGYVASPGYFETLVKNADGSFTLTKKDKTTYNFNSVPGTPFLVAGPVWPLTSIVDRNGNTTTLTYTGGNLTGITDTYGRTTALTYNFQNKLATLTDPAGRVTTLQYDATGHMLTSVTDPNGKSLQYSYNELYQMIKRVDKDGRITTYSYSNGKPVSIKDGNGAARATISNPNNWATDAQALAMFQLRVYVPSTTTNVDGRGNVWKYQYDSNGYVTQRTAPDGATTTYTYDPATLQVASITDANGHTTAYQYDSMGNRIRVTDPLGYVTTYTYEPVFNMMTSMTDPRGRKTIYAYDAHGNRITETDPLAQIQSWTYDSHGNVLTHTDKNRHTTSNQYDSFGDLTKTTDPLGNMTTMTYDAVGNMLTRTDANGHTTTDQYDGMNRLTKETDALGHPTQTIYDGEGDRIQAIDRNGHATTYQYDLRRRLIRMTDALGHSETYAHDGNDNRASLTDRNGHTTTYSYDSQNRRDKITDALGDVTSMLHDGAGNVTSETDANSHTTTYTYDALNRRVTMTDATGAETRYFYDTGTFSGPVTLGGVTVTCNQCGATPGSRAVTEVVDADGIAGIHAGVNFRKYDALGRIVISERKTGCIGGPMGAGCPDTITPNDAVFLYSYDPVGNRLTATEPDGDTTTYDYDDDNRRVQEVNAAGDTISTTYDGVGNVHTTTASNLNVTTNQYDGDNRVVQVSDSIGLVTTYTYDPEGNRLSEADGNGNTTSHTYDVLNRLIATTDALGQTTIFQYDAVGNLIKTTDRNGNSTSDAYDAINRRITITDALNHSTHYEYDKVGNLIKLTDANGHVTLYTYDADNRRTAETYADSKIRNFTYDEVGNLATRTDQIGQTTTYKYNDLYFLVSRTYPSAVNDSLGYDLSGRMLTAQRGAWTVSFFYDGANRVTKTIQEGQTITYSYNIPGRTRTLTYPGGRSLTEHTDARSRLAQIDDASSPPIVQYTYDLGNRVLNRAYRNGTTAAYGYNADNWIISLQHSHGATGIAGFNYAYDHEGNKEYESKLQDLGHSEGYEYDAAYRLIDYRVGSLVGSSVPVPITEIGYDIDPVGNLCKKTDTCQFDEVNEETKFDGTVIPYNGDGDPLSDAKYDYQYDEENRLTQITRHFDSAVCQYQYDALGRRVQKIPVTAGACSATLYFYDDQRIIEEQNGGAVTQATYVYGNYIDEALTMDRGGQTYYYHPNALWSVEAVTDTSASPVERYSYEGFGPVTISNGAGVSLPLNGWGTAHSQVANPWIFTGRQLDEETGLYFYRARHYDSAEGRFLERDSLGYVDSMDLYEYGKDNPTRWLDPSGNDTCNCDVPDPPEIATPTNGAVCEGGDVTPKHDCPQGGHCVNSDNKSTCDTCTKTCFWVCAKNKKGKLSWEKNCTDSCNQ